MGVTGILCSFKLFVEWTAGKVIHQSSSIDLSENISANNFALSHAEENIAGPLNTGEIAGWLCWEHY